MITEITIENFKSFGKPQTIPLKPITLLYGPNSSGKSSIIQLLLMLKQTLEHSGNDALVSKGDLVDLGDFENFINNHKNDKKLSVVFKYSLPKDIDDYGNYSGFSNLVFTEEIKNVIKDKLTHLKIKSTFFSSDNRSELNSIQYFLSNDSLPIIEFKNTANFIKWNKWSYLNSYIKMEEKFSWKSLSVPSERLLNIFDFVNKEHPIFISLYNKMKKEIETIKIPIKYKLEQVLGSNFNLADLSKMTKSDFIELFKNRRKKASKARQKDDILNKLERFYKREFDPLRNIYIHYSKFNFNLFVDDFRNCAGPLGLTKLNKYVLSNYLTDHFLKTTDYFLEQDRFIENKTKNILRSNYVSKIYKNYFGILEALDPMCLFDKERTTSFASDIPDEAFLYENLSPSDKRSLDGFKKKVIKLASPFASGLEDAMKDFRKFNIWYENWGHFGLVNFNKKRQFIEDDIENYKFSKYHRSVLDYIKYINIRFMKVNLREFVRKTEQEILFLFDRMQYIAPVRALPERFYLKKGNMSKDITGQGEQIPELLINAPNLIKDLNEIFKMLNVEYVLRNASKTKNLKSNQVFQLKLLDKKTNTIVNLKDLGQGIAQLLPIITRSLLSSSEVVLIEQPEIHIHPRLQAELGEVLNFLRKKKRNRFIIETHSEALILRLQKLIRNKELKPEDIAVIYVEKDGGESICKELRLDENGDFLDAWPGGFFEEGYREMFE